MKKLLLALLLPSIVFAHTTEDRFLASATGEEKALINQYETIVSRPKLLYACAVWEGQTPRGDFYIGYASGPDPLDRAKGDCMNLRRGGQVTVLRSAR
jgi:hypothetical protein